MSFRPITSWKIGGETVANLILGGLQNHCRLVTASRKLKDAYSFEGIL